LRARARSVENAQVRIRGLRSMGVGRRDGAFADRYLIIVQCL
jgi:hypothetical protein